MIYCPHCKKPSARDRGNCPHCGGVLTPSKMARDPIKDASNGSGAPDIGFEKTMMAAPGSIPESSRQSPTDAKHESKTVKDATAGFGGSRLQLKPNPFAGQPLKTPSFPQKDTKPEIKRPSQSQAGPSKSEAEPERKVVQTEPKQQAEQMPELQVERSLISMTESMVSQVSGYQGGAAYTSEALSLDIASLPPPPPVKTDEPAPPKKKDLDDFKVRELAGFGIPAAGAVGALKYWLKVRKRLDELSVEYEQAVDGCRTVLVKKKAACAELGRQAGTIAIEDASVAPLISKAAAAEKERVAKEQERFNSASEHKAQIEPIDIKIKFVESEAQPYYEKEKQALEEQRKLVAARKRIESKMSEIGNELKGVDEQIEKLQLLFSDLSRPKEERDRLLKDIAFLDRKRQPLLKQTDELGDELAVLGAPLAAADSKLKEIRGILNAKLDEIRELNAEKHKLLRQFHKLDSDAQKQLEEESSKVDALWAAAGEKIVEKRTKEPRLEKFESKALASITAAEEAQTKVELIAQARESYDKDTVEKAKRLAAIIAAVAGGVIILLLILGKM